MTHPKKSNHSAVPQYRMIADRISASLDADVLLFNAEVERHWDQTVIELVCSRRRRQNVALFLVTAGGDPDAAYRIASCLQTKYNRFIVFVPGYCKSSGTLISLGAHEVVISDRGELGPLDVQMQRKDEIFVKQSGLTATAALETLNSQAWEAFSNFLVRIAAGSTGMSTRMASEIASKMVAGLFTPIYQQIDPLHVGEAGRALKIARDYGTRLLDVSENFKGRLETLVTGYPSHSFIIDLKEARKYFTNIREFNDVETELLNALGSVGRWPLSRSDEMIVTFLSTEIPAVQAGAPEAGGQDAGPEKPRSEAKTRTRSRRRPTVGDLDQAAPNVTDIKHAAKPRS